MAEKQEDAKKVMEGVRTEWREREGGGEWG